MAIGQQQREHSHAEAILQKQHQRHLNFANREAMLGEEFKYPTGIFGFIARYNQAGEIEVLLVYRPDYQIWNLPGGGIDAYEDPKTAVMREVEEETGLQTVAWFSLFYIKDKPVEKENPIGSESREDFFGVIACWVAGGQLALSDESKDIRWFSVNNLPEGDALFSRHRWAIQTIMNDKDLRTIVEESTARHRVNIHAVQL